MVQVWDISQLLAPLGIVAAFAALCDLRMLRVRLPSRNWQVPQSWKRFPPSVMAACFGFIIGLGVITRIPFASFYFVLIACVALGSVPAAVVLLALYGAARAGAVALIARGQAFARNPHERLETMARLGPVIGYLDGLGLALFAALLLGQATPFHF
jgi:hypothetical protein